MSHTFYIVDVFAEEKYAGNQLAVVLEAGDLSSGEMQRVASEMNYSETSFVLSTKRDAHRVRIFTPREELPFAGHPTLGTAYVIRHEAPEEPAGRLVLEVPAGRIPVDFGEVLWMHQLPPAFGGEHDRQETARSLGLKERDLDPELPVETVSTGIPVVIVPLRDLDALRRCRPLGVREKSVYAFCPGSHGDGPGDLSARMFAGGIGVTEDPATGSAAGCLASYLVEHRGGPVDLRVEQGYEIGRPSLLHLRAGRDEAGTMRVSVGGRVQLVARGELL
ncbi:MAG: PhzF family phenazine biosynthesis protein [Rubrobacteraceae bacterium]|uniref:PhzF family phenazine biosynthesis protein n=1 Tax=Rubrobacter naiadicus TaxID=1392641 RepID=UPI00235E36B4|nr:PhzF family phenazine biosynthesis protein [Rubrobacter naiadicus]MCL6439527.1 PhzF family phenazine biosynthesis protein [Rubrobacteraceae bacterium]